MVPDNALNRLVCHIGEFAIDWDAELEAGSEGSVESGDLLRET